MKQCTKCKIIKNNTEFGISSNNNDGLRYDCKECRKKYNKENKISKRNYNQKYYQINKNNIFENNKVYRLENKEKIYLQRKQYRENNKESIKQKMISYKNRRNELIKERRKYDIEYKITENLKTKIHNVLSKKSRPSSELLIGCNYNILVEFLEYQFDSSMNWDNYGKIWHIDHVLPIKKFNLIDIKNQKICFNWKNLQPLLKHENQSKSDNIILHMFFNHLITLMRFIKYKSLNNEYQGVIEKLHWLRNELRYGKNLKDN